MQFEVGAVLEGKVTSITKFGAFVALPEGKTGMVHISEVAPTFVREIRDHLKEGDEVRVAGVRRLLYETVYNLCDNAIQYNVDGGSVTLRTEKAGQEARITVADTGIGIPQDAQARVFERFYRVDKSHSKASGGTGLGLSIVKHAVQYHNGKIALQSTPNHGTSITVTIPKA